MHAPKAALSANPPMCVSDARTNQSAAHASVPGRPARSHWYEAKAKKKPGGSAAAFLIMPPAMSRELPDATATRPTSATGTAPRLERPPGLANARAKRNTGTASASGRNVSVMRTAATIAARCSITIDRRRATHAWK